MSRDLETNFASGIAQTVVPLAIMLYADLPSGAWYGWSGLRELSYDGQTWEPLGGLVSISDYEESTDSASRGVSVTLSQITDADRLSDILDQSYWGRSAKIWLATLDSTHTPTGRYTIFSGSMDTDDFDLGPDNMTVRVALEHRLSALLRQRLARWTPEDQKRLYPATTDDFFEFVHLQKDLELPWAR